MPSPWTRERAGDLNAPKVSNTSTAGNAYGGRDVPISYSWRAGGDWLACIGLSPGNSDFDKALAAIALQARLVAHLAPDSAISHSRRRDHYSEARRYNGTPYTYATVPAAIDMLADAGWLEVWKAPPGRHSTGRQSTHKATAALVEAVPIDLLTPRLTFDPGELIRLKDGKGDAARLMRYSDTGATRAMRQELRRFNEALRCQTVRLEHPEARADGPAIRCEGVTFLPQRRDCYRVFSRGTFKEGGRLYGPAVQSLPKPMRDAVTINGERTAEPDFKQLNPQVAYIAIGRPDLADAIERSERNRTGDAYFLPNWDRDLAKRAFNACVCAESERSAVQAIAAMPACPGNTPAEKTAKAARLIRDLKRMHSPLADAGLFHSGAGLRLQRIDSDLTADVLRRTLLEGVPVQPIHDGFRTPERHAGAVLEAMESARAAMKTRYAAGI